MAKNGQTSESREEQKMQNVPSDIANNRYVDLFLKIFLKSKINSKR